MYFRKFNTIKYKNDGYFKEVKNILKAVLPKFNNIGESFVFQNYIVESGERPESVSQKMYGTPDYYWTILVINNIVNPYLDWPMSDEEVELYTTSVYGKEFIYDVHHFFHLDTGKWLDEVDTAFERTRYPEGTPAKIIPVTNLQYEIDKNRERKSIIIINPKYIQRFVEAYNRAIEGKEE